MCRILKGKCFALGIKLSFLCFSYLFYCFEVSKRSEKTEFNQIAVINYYHSKIASTVQVQLEREHNESLHFFLQAIYLQWTLLLHLSNQEI